MHERRQGWTEREHVLREQWVTDGVEQGAEALGRYLSADLHAEIDAVTMQNMLSFLRFDLTGVEHGVTVQPSNRPIVWHSLLAVEFGKSSRTGAGYVAVRLNPRITNFAAAFVPLMLPLHSGRRDSETLARYVNSIRQHVLPAARSMLRFVTQGEEALRVMIADAQTVERMLPVCRDGWEGLLDVLPDHVQLPAEWVAYFADDLREEYERLIA
jgi:hypothetical protein